MRLNIDTDTDTADLPDVLDALANGLVAAASRTPTREMGDALVAAQTIVDLILAMLVPDRAPISREPAAPDPTVLGGTEPTTLERAGVDEETDHG